MAENLKWRNGQARKICGAKRKTREGDEPGRDYPCTLVAGYGTNHKGYGHCKFHFGNSPAHITQAETERAEDAVRTFGLPIDIDPQEALLQELRRTAGVVAYLEDVIAEFDKDQLVQYDDVGPHGHKRVSSAWVVMYQAERGHLVRVAAEAHKCGVAERQVQIEERQGLLLAEVIKRILVELDVFGMPNTPEVVRKHMLWADRVLEIESSSIPLTGASTAIPVSSRTLEATAT